MTEQTIEQATEAIELDVNAIGQAIENAQRARQEAAERPKATFLKVSKYEKGDTFTFTVTRSVDKVLQDRDFATKEPLVDKYGAPVPHFYVNGNISGDTYLSEGEHVWDVKGNYLTDLVTACKAAGGSGLPKQGDVFTFTSTGSEEIEGTKFRRKTRKIDYFPGGKGAPAVQAPAPAPAPAPTAESVAKAANAAAEINAAEASEYVKVSDGQPFPTSGMNQTQIDMLIEGKVIQAAA